MSESDNIRELRLLVLRRSDLLLEIEALPGATDAAVARIAMALDVCGVALADAEEGLAERDGVPVTERIRAAFDELGTSIAEVRGG